MIEARALVKVLGTRRALDGVSFTIEPGTVVGLIGPNGAGKSTLLRVLAAETTPDGGAVLIDGRDVRDQSVGALARQRAMLPQTLDLAFDFSVRELALLGRTPHAPAETPACAAMVARCLRAVGIEEHADRAVAALSGGERQRAHLARVLAQIGLGETGHYLLLDEPVSNQDPSWQLQLLDVIASIAERGVGVAIVLHDLNLAARSCGVLVLMKDGKIVRAGSPRDVLEASVLGDVFDAQAHIDDDPWTAGVPRVTFRRAPTARP